MVSLPFWSKHTLKCLALGLLFHRDGCGNQYSTLLARQLPGGGMDGGLGEQCPTER